jgi:hypothetical protein
MTVWRTTTTPSTLVQPTYMQNSISVAREVLTDILANANFYLFEALGKNSHIHAKLGLNGRHPSKRVVDRQCHCAGRTRDTTRDIKRFVSR